MADQSFSSNWEQAFHRANSLLAAGQSEAALSVLREARDAAQREQQLVQASFFARVLGSFLVVQARHQEALSAYRKAEALDPDSAHAKMAVAEHLLRLQQLTQALQKFEEAQRLAESAPERHAIAAGIGLAYEALGNRVSAVHAFRRAADAVLVGELHASACDLRLVQEILQDESVNAEAEAYLSTVEEKARFEGNKGVLETLAEIRAWPRLL